MEHNVLWRKVIDTKDGTTWESWSSTEVKGLYGVCLWKNIRGGWDRFSLDQM